LAASTDCLLHGLKRVRLAGVKHVSPHLGLQHRQLQDAWQWLLAG
jgi:hypothetical protein